MQNENQNENQNEKQVFVVRPRTPKLKNDWLTVTLKVLLFAGIFFSLFYMGKLNFNSLFLAIIDPSYSDAFGISLSGYMASMGNSMLIAMKILLPAILAAIYFAFYFLFERMFAALVFNQLRVFGVGFDRRRFSICLDGCMIGLSILVGISQVIFNYYPLLNNLGGVFVPPLLGIIVMALFYFIYSRSLEKLYRPLILNVMLLPTIVIVLFA